MLRNTLRPYIFLYRTLFLLLILRCYKSNCITGWKYFFASWSNFRIDHGSLNLNVGVWLEKEVLLDCISGCLSVGKRTFINKGSLIVCKDNISIGNDVLIADYVSIYDHDHNMNANVEEDYVTAPVVIKDGAWIASHTVVLKGVTIGEGSVVGAGSVVTKDIPAGEVWVGAPAQFIKKIGPTK